MIMIIFIIIIHAGRVEEGPGWRLRTSSLLPACLLFSLRMRLPAFFQRGGRSLQE